MTRLTDAYTNALAQSMAPKLEHAATCRATGNHLAAQNDEPEWDRGEATQPAILDDDATWQEFDRLRNVGKGERLARINDQHAAALDLQQLDVMRKVGAL